MSNLESARNAKLSTLLDSRRRVGGIVTSWRELVNSGYFVTRRIENGTHYLCVDVEAKEYYKVPKMVSEYAGNLPTLNITIDKDGRIASKDWY